MDDVPGRTDRDLAEAVRAACLRAATEAYEDGGFRGLCAEGRWELALDAMRAVDLRAVIDRTGGATSAAPAEDAAS